jgi:integrase
VQRNWLRVVRNLCLYRRRTIPDVFVPDPTGFPKPHAPIRPYIFTTTDIARLLDAADHLVATSRSPLRRETFRLAIVLLYTSGLRRGELVRLIVGDYDPSEQTLLIRASKFHKSRRLPLSSDAQRELEAYLRTRRHRGFPTAPDSALIWNRSRRGGRPYTGEAVRCEIDALFRAADIRTATEIQAALLTIDRTTRDGRRDYALLATMFNTGARVQEILDLRPSDVQLVSPAHVRLFGKGRKEQLCPLWPQTAQLLRAYISERGLTPASTEPLFVSHRGAPLTRFGVRYLLAKYCDRPAPHVLVSKESGSTRTACGTARPSIF